MIALHFATYILGMLLGLLLAPLVFLRGVWRGVRAFHPDGVVFRARFVPLTAHPAAARLAGAALVRLSPTFVRGGAERQDVLGLAVRFRDGDSLAPARDAGDQDLLTASFRSFGSVKTDMARTDVHDWLDNDFHAVAAFRVPGAGVAALRFIGLRRPAGTGSRADRLAQAIAAGQAAFVLEVSQEIDAWLALGRLELLAPVSLDQQALAMSPFHHGRGLIPVGFVNGIRRVAYLASVAGRRLRRS